MTWRIPTFSSAVVVIVVVAAQVVVISGVGRDFDVHGGRD